MEASDDVRSDTSALGAGITVKKDVAYGNDAAHRLDVYVPATAKGAPILFMVHGGAWRLGDKGADKVVTNKVAHWVSSKGYIFITTNYRLDGINPIEQAQEVAQALAFAQKSAPGWGGDAARLVLMGHSAGAHLVSLLAADAEFARAAGAKPWLGTIALDSAAYDIKDIMQRSHYRFYDRVFGRDEQFWKQASPLQRLTSKAAPFLAVCSSNRDDSCPQAEAFVGKAKSLGGQASLVRVPMSHADINGELGLAGDYTKQVDAFIATLGLP